MCQKLEPGIGTGKTKTCTQQPKIMSQYYPADYQRSAAKSHLFSMWFSNLTHLINCDIFKSIWLIVHKLTTLTPLFWSQVVVKVVVFHTPGWPIDHNLQNLILFDICRNMLEKNLELLMDYVDDLSQETNKYINYQRNVGKVQMAKQQYLYKRVSTLE